MVEKKRAKEEEGRGVARTLASRVFLLPFIRWQIIFLNPHQSFPSKGSGP